APVLADPDWLRQIVGGIIGNTVKHARQATLLTVQCGTTGDESWCEMTDDGPGTTGMECTEGPSRFGHAPRSGSFGIGLALARWVTEAQGGRLTLRSPVADGRGFAVRITMPRAVSQIHQEAAE
ncbi:MAG: sensor histidine kinase, partial [Paracoccaceae bacterium]